MITFLSVTLPLAVLSIFNAKAAITWNVQSSPDPSTTTNALFGVAAIAPNDAFAVGLKDTQPLVEHWDGNQWSVLQSSALPKNFASLGSALVAVAALSSSNVWAAGHCGLQPLLEHWDGAAWSIVSAPSPACATATNLTALAAIAVDVWAAGTYIAQCPNQRGRFALALHWNGRAWSVVSVPTAANKYTYITGVAAGGSSDVWMVGYTVSGSSGSNALVEHWNCSSWSIVSAPSPGNSAALYGVVAISSTDAWAVGSNASGGISEH